MADNLNKVVLRMLGTREIVRRSRMTVEYVISAVKISCVVVCQLVVTKGWTAAIDEPIAGRAAVNHVLKDEPFKSTSSFYLNWISVDPDFDGSARGVLSLMTHRIFQANGIAAIDLPGFKSADLDEIRFELVDSGPLVRGIEVDLEPTAINVLLMRLPMHDKFGYAPTPGSQGLRVAGNVVVINTDAHRIGLQVDDAALAKTVVHEVGHYLGLSHTSESDGLQFDDIDDTAECVIARDADHDGTLNPEECRGDGGSDNAMFWKSDEFTEIPIFTAGQLEVIRKSPLAW